MLELEMRHLLLRGSEEPDDTDENIRRYVIQKMGYVRTSSLNINKPDLSTILSGTTGAIILGAAYGYTPSIHGKDRLLELSETAMEIFSAISDCGAWMVDISPLSEST